MSFTGKLWSPGETAKLRSLIRKNEPLDNIEHEFPGRTLGAIQRKIIRIKEDLAATSSKEVMTASTPKAMPAASATPTAAAKTVVNAEASAGDAGPHVFRQYLEALSLKKPVQYRNKLLASAPWQALETNPHAVYALMRGDASKFEFRLAPAFITVNGVQVPAPTTVALKKGEVYFVPSVSGEQMVLRKTWSDSPFDQAVLKRHLIHLKEQDAIQHTKAMLKFA